MHVHRGGHGAYQRTTVHELQDASLGQVFCDMQRMDAHQLCGKRTTDESLEMSIRLIRMEILNADSSPLFPACRLLCRVLRLRPHRHLRSSPRQNGGHGQLAALDGRDGLYVGKRGSR